MSAVLIIDDESDFSGFLGEALEAHGHQVAYADCVDVGLRTLECHEFDIILLDNRMPGMSGLEALAEFKHRGIDTPVIMMTSEGTSETAIKATSLHVFHYVLKGLDVELLVERLEPRIRQAEATGKNRRRTRIPSEVDRDDPGERELLGNSDPMLEVYRQIGQVAGSIEPVLIQGETGTGKELVARAIHDYSPRRDERFVPLNVAAITESLLESELFGHEKGVYTGADRIRKGCFEHADGGTLFLDEIGEMPAALQAKLLRVLAMDGTQEVRRIGSNTPITVDVRVVWCDQP